MKTNRNMEENLRKILKEDGLEKPSDHFSAQLTHTILQKYQKSKREELKISTWLGPAVLVVLVSFNVMFLFYLIPFSIQPVLITTVVAFILGLWALIALIKKDHRSTFDSLG